ncbi:hypothetical protein [Polluticoccus soli]|uniref:hypothetical protein n=1 Tax=Polluticoccus soli TaxID=3034150 RepID=UPI0023E1BDB8|nr:hypothetical protein [Flavipsychrobacter sp. JY13-12]
MKTLIRALSITLIYLPFIAFAQSDASLSGYKGKVKEIKETTCDILKADRSRVDSSSCWSISYVLDERGNFTEVKDNNGETIKYVYEYHGSRPAVRHIYSNGELSGISKYTYKDDSTFEVNTSFVGDAKPMNTLYVLNSDGTLKKALQSGKVREEYTYNKSGKTYTVFLDETRLVKETHQKMDAQQNVTLKEVTGLTGKNKTQRIWRTFSYYQ